MNFTCRRTLNLLFVAVIISFCVVYLDFFNVGWRYSMSSMVVGNVRNLRNHSIKFKDSEFSYAFLKTPRNTCDNETEVLIIVLSVASHFDIRQAIRDTWASSNNSKIVKEKKARINFIFSSGANLTYPKEVQDEIEIFDDLIITNLPETYDNLILKVHSLLTYKQEYCQNTNFLLKIDEDVILDIDNMFETAIKSSQFANVDAISGFIWKNAIPKRDRGNKWYISRSFWPAKYFPDYCDGPTYLIGKNPVSKMLNETKNQQIWKLEDVFWTGVVAKSANIPRLHWNLFMLRDEMELNSSRVFKCYAGKKRHFQCHGLKSPEKLKAGFDRLINLKCV